MKTDFFQKFLLLFWITQFIFYQHHSDIRAYDFYNEFIHGQYSLNIM